MVCAYLQAAHLAVHISFGVVAADPQDRNHTLSKAHRHTLTQIHICLLRSPLHSSFIQKHQAGNKRFGQVRQSEEQEKKVVCVLSVGGSDAEDAFAYSSFFLSLSSPSAVSRGAL